MKRAIIVAVLALGSVGCTAASGGSAKSAVDADSSGLNAGTKICISELAGVRYTLEDVLRAQHLEPARSCTVAKIRLEESGAPRAWIMRYQHIGDGKWKECKSNAAERSAFAEQCVGQMLTDLGG